MVKDIQLWNENNIKYAFIFLLFVLVILIFNDISKPGLASYDDCYYARKGVEMINGGDLITPYFMGREDFINPPFFFWMLALSIKIFGNNPFALKLLPALCGFLTVIAAYFIGKEIKNRFVGWWSAFFLSTTYIFLKSSRRVMMDIPFMFFVAVSLYFFIRGYNIMSGKKSSKDKSPLLSFLLFGLFAGLGGLIKTVFIIFPLGIPVLFLLIRREWKILLNRSFIAGIVTGIIAFGWWPIYEIIRYGNRFIEGFYRNMLSGHIGNEGYIYGPFGYLLEFGKHFWLWLPLGIWSLWIIFTRKRWKNDPLLQLLLLSGLFPLVLLSFFSDKPIRYVLFTFVPILTWTALIFCERILSGAKLFKYGNVALCFLIILSAYLVIRPIDYSDIRNGDYIQLGDFIRDHKIDAKDARFYHYGGEYWLNQNPMLYYTGKNLSGIVEREDELKNIINKDGITYLIVKTDELHNLPMDKFEKITDFDRRTLLKLKKIRSLKNLPAGK